MSNPFKIGDRVKMSDADSPTSIPAYRALRGTVVEVTGGSSVKVKWDCDTSPDAHSRGIWTIRHAND